MSPPPAAASSLPRDDVPPSGGCGGGPGEFFHLAEGASIAWRWDPRTNKWEQWFIPSETPAKASPPPADEADEDDKKDDTSPASSTASPFNRAMYEAAAEKYRNGTGWLIGAAGSVAALLIGTASLTHGASAFSLTERTPQFWGLLVALVSVISILGIAAWLRHPMDGNLRSVTKGVHMGFPRWRKTFRRQYEERWLSALEGRATSLEGYQRYREAWLGTLSDIDRSLSQVRRGDGADARYALLARYKQQAEDVIGEDTPNVLALSSEGVVRRLGARARVALTLVVLLSIIAAASYLVFLGGTGEPPRITSLTAEPNAPEPRQEVTIRVQATGSGFAYEWWHDDEPLEKATGPVLRIGNYRKRNAGTYTVRVTGSDGEGVDVDRITLLPPSK